MKVAEFSRQLQGLPAPWFVSVVELSVADKEVLVRVEHDASLASYGHVRRVMNRAVKRGLNWRAETDRDLLFPFLGMDERSIQRGQNYLTILTDVHGRRVLEVVVGRTKGAACKLLKTSLNAAQRASEKAVAGAHLWAVTCQVWSCEKAPAENMNGRIQPIKVNARGFRKPENFRIVILFFLGKLSFYLLESS